MRRLAALATVFLLAAACSGGEPAPTTTTTPATTAAPTTVPTTTAAPPTTAGPTTTTTAPTTTFGDAPPPVDLTSSLLDALAALETTTVNFALASSEIDDAAQAALRDVAAALRANSGVAVRVTGHTDASGADRTNRDLSAQRARAVQTWLVEEGGVNEGFIEIDGRGDRVPVADNTTEAGRADNRRADISVPDQRDRGLLYRRWDGTSDAAVTESRPPDFQAVTGGAFGQAGVCDMCVVELTGFLTPPRSGTYVLSLAPGGEATMWLALSEDPEVPVVENAGSAAPDDFIGGSGPVDLEQDTRHALRVVMTVDGGPDHLFIGWSAGGRAEQMSPRAVEPAETG